jgi:hypothetical protein
VSDDLLIDDDELLPGELAFTSADLERQITDLTAVLKRKDEEAERSLTQLQLDANAEYKLIVKERQMIEEELNTLKTNFGRLEVEGENISLEGKQVFDRLVELDKERMIGVLAIRFLARRISDGLISVGALPNIDKNIYVALRAWAEKATPPFFEDGWPEDKALGEILMEMFKVTGTTGSYANMSGRIQELLTEDESEDFQKYMDKVPIIDPLGITSKTARLYAKISPELAGVIPKAQSWKPRGADDI